MKLTFDCGIVGTSHDAAGDLFLAGRVEDERRNEQRLIEHIQAPVLTELKRTQQALCYLIDKAGGEVRIPLLETLKEVPVSDWLVYLDEATQEIVLMTHRK